MSFLKQMKPIDSMEDTSTGRSLLKYFDIGQIGSSHGLRGEVKLFLFDTEKDRMRDIKTAYLMDSKKKTYMPIEIVSVKMGKQPIIKIKDIDTPEEAEYLKFYYICVDREHAKPLTDNNFFIADVIGFDVVDTQLGFIGKLKDVLQNTGQDLYIVERPGKPDLLFPGVKSILLDVDFSEGKLSVALPSGLTDLYE